MNKLTYERMIIWQVHRALPLEAASAFQTLLQIKLHFSLLLILLKLGSGPCIILGSFNPSNLVVPYFSCGQWVRFSVGFCGRSYCWL